jgi:hypothetical protein
MRPENMHELRLLTTRLELGFVFAGDGPIEDGMQTICCELTLDRFQLLRQTG